MDELERVPILRATTGGGHRLAEVCTDVMPEVR
jgi:hypothetical protein